LSDRFVLKVEFVALSKDTTTRPYDASWGNEKLVILKTGVLIAINMIIPGVRCCRRVLGKESFSNGILESRRLVKA
jgi:hypothetical protein